MSERDELLDGYRDGFADDRDELPADTNRTALYVFGWRNARDDRKRQPRAFTEIIRREGEEALELYRP